MTGYPQAWEADVVLADGGPVHLRPITAEDGELLVAFHSRLSAETIRFRFFAAHPKLSPKEVEHFTHVDYDERVAFVAVLGGEIIAVGRYEQAPGTDVAEVAFVVDDAHQRRGVGSVLLEHLAAAAAERGLRRFEAEVLTENRGMAGVFRDAGYQATRSYDEDVLRLVFPIEPTAASLAVRQSREHRSEARSVARLLHPRSVAVVGAGRDPRGVGHAVLVNLIRSGFQGPVYPVNPQVEHVASVHAYPRVQDVPDQVDLAVVAVPAAAVPDVIAQCAGKGVHGLVVLSAGYSESGPAGTEAERTLVATARTNGMRVIGPNCLGVMNNASDVRLNASLAPRLPRAGRAGLFSQSGSLGMAILDMVSRRGVGLSSFVSAGNRADVSGNDLLQYWEDDAGTDVVLLYLESFGNPRKFARLARRLGRSKPIVAVKSRGSVAARLSAVDEVTDGAVDALFRQAGVIRVDTLSQLLDVAALLTSQPLPAGRRVAVVGNSDALGRLAADACAGGGLEVRPLTPETQEALRSAFGSTVAVGNPVVLRTGLDAGALQQALAAVVADPGVDALVTVFVAPVGLSALEMARLQSVVTAPADKPVVATFLALDRQSSDRQSSDRKESDRQGSDGQGSDGQGSGGQGSGGQGSGGEPEPGRVPLYPSPEEAVSALARTVAYAEWRRRPEGTVPVLDGLDSEGARNLVERALPGCADGRPLEPDLVARLLQAYGVQVRPSLPAGSLEAAVAGARELGYPVALKATAPSLRHRPELGGIRLSIDSEEDLRAAYADMTARLGGPAAGLIVQAMAPPGVATVIRVHEDPAFGALVSFGVGGAATDLLGDRAFRILPMTDVDAAEIVRAVRAAPILFGYRDSEPVDVAALEQLLLRVARMADDLPELAELELNPVITSPSGVNILQASARLTVPAARLDSGPRRMG